MVCMKGDNFVTIEMYEISFFKYILTKKERKMISSSPTPSRLFLQHPITTSPCIPNTNNNTQRINHRNGMCLAIQQPTRRNLLSISILSTIISPILHSNSSLAAQTDEELARYTDTNEGFTLLVPKSWIKIDKAGATLLFEDPSKGSNNVGVVVTPVRLTSLGEFGDPQFVSNKLIQSEKRKESTKDVQLVSCVERPGQNRDIQVYEFEYKLDSTRGGLKTIFSAAFVASKKLYLLNIAHSDNPEQPLGNHKRMILEQVLHSFDVTPFLPKTAINSQI